ncbi:hypothetical protein Vadar_030244 [Vaccinium darrowii]|uniref:Uncharacterized protein n=1 Tax=Vaccinium darrowii TaxID=229202 RepID=A0ACB7Z769_9ERIC|nr:hypothetical protein Vadar_030244 [Vaccinium darrowii]
MLIQSVPRCNKVKLLSRDRENRRCVVHKARNPSHHIIIYMVGSGEKSLLSFNLLHRARHQHHQQGGGGGGKIPKGCMAIKVGHTGEEQRRFVVPVMYLNHPLFMHLLKEAEEEYGFDQKGTITIPCHVEQFRCVQGLIDQDHHHHHHVGCFWV